MQEREWRARRDVPTIYRALLARFVSRPRGLVRVRCVPIARETCWTRAGKRESESRTEKHKGMGPQHAKTAREKASLSNAKKGAFPPSPADANRTVRKPISRRTLLDVYAPSRGCTITDENGREKGRPASRTRRWPVGLSPLSPRLCGWISLPTMSPKPPECRYVVAAAAGNAGTADL